MIEIQALECLSQKTASSVKSAPKKNIKITPSPPLRSLSLCGEFIFEAESDLKSNWIFYKDAFTGRLRDG